MRIEEVSGISKEMIKRLKDVGIERVEDVIIHDVNSLSLLLNCTRSTAAKILNVCKIQYKPLLKKASEIEKEWEQLGRLHTGSKNLDDLLGGGLLFQAMTELAGEFASGKSQSVFTFSVMAVAQGYSVIFIDSERTIRPRRLREIAEHRGINPDEVLENVHIISAERSNELVAVIEKLGDIIKEFNDNNPNRRVGLVIVDSLTAPFRADFPGRETLALRQQLLGHATQELQRVAKEHNLVVVFTNQVMQKPDLFQATVPIGGPTLAHKAAYRLFYRKSRDNLRIVRILDAPDLPPGETVIKITDKGIEDHVIKKNKNDENKK